MSLVEPSIEESLRDRYEIKRELGRGGMATVYLARDLRHGRSVAIKVLRPEVAAGVAARREPLGQGSSPYQSAATFWSEHIAWLWIRYQYSVWQRNWRGG